MALWQALTEWFEDAIAGLLIVLGVRPVRSIFAHFLFSVLVTGASAMTSPPPVALGHMHADVYGMVT